MTDRVNDPADGREPELALLREVERAARRVAYPTPTPRIDAIEALLGARLAGIPTPEERAEEALAGLRRALDAYSQAVGAAR